MAFCGQNFENKAFSVLHVIRIFVLHFGGFNVCSGLFRSEGAFDMYTDNNFLSVELSKGENTAGIARTSALTNVSVGVKNANAYKVTLAV